MKRKFTSLLLSGLMCLMGANAWALSQVNGVYQISTADELAEFAALVNGGEANANAVLLNDIDYTANSVQIGNPTFNGTFDGQGHKVTVAFEGTDTKGVNAALFYKVLGTVKNLSVSGTITSPLDNVASIAFNLYGLVDHCYSDATIRSTKSGSCSSAGIVGQSYGGSAITNCFFAGKLTSETATNFAGIMGWSDGTNVAVNCLVVAEAEGSACGNSSCVIARNLSRADNSYYLYNADANFTEPDFKSDRQTVGSRATTTEELASGAIAYKLGWGQELGVDATPNPLSTKRVYPLGSCTEPTGYTNDAAQSAHSFAGYKCSVCGAYKPDFMTPVDGVYQIGTADQLCWFAKKVNAKDLDIDAVLTADIDMAGVADFPTIGATGVEMYYNLYRGTFDGQYHKVSNLNVNMPETEGVGLFGTVGPGAVIKNLFTDETCNFYGFKKIGGIMGFAYGIGSTAPVTMLNLGSAANVAAVPVAEGGNSDAGVGGIVGNCAGGIKGTITNCWFEGEVSGTSSAFISGWCGTNQFTLTSCWSTSESSAASLMTRAGSSGASVTLKNCFAVRGTQANAITTDDVTGGALCFGLNEGIEEPAWHQTLGKDAKPSLQGTDLVYRVGTKNCDGTDGAGFGYSNENTGFTQMPHQLDPTTGLCSVCGQLPPDEDGWYNIPTVAAFLAFAEMAKTDDAMKVRLTADLNFEGVADDWAPIGGAKVFKGTFDGQNHIISNMVLNQPEKSDFGMFKTGANVTLKNFILDPTCSITGAQKVGIIGNHSGANALFENIGNMAPVDGEGENVGGLFGGAWAGSATVTINSCWVVGDITTRGPKNPANCAAFSGWSNTGTFVFNNCWTTANVPNSTNAAKYLARNGGTLVFNDCLSLYGTQVPLIEGIAPDFVAEALASGELAYKLNGDQKTIKWYQTLGEDATPVPWDTHKQVYPDGPVNCDGSPIGVIAYSNTPNSNLPTHDFQHGFCTKCGSLDKDYLTPVDGYYELADGLDLAWFSAMVNSSNANKKLNARLTADIDMTEANERFEIIKNYAGTFDGQFHRISNLVITRDADDVGMFALVMAGVTIKNLILDSSCSITGNKYVGLVASNEFNQTDGNINLINLGFEGTITAYGVNGGGIIGCNHSSNAFHHITNCYVTGLIDGQGGESGAISGWVGNATGSNITACWSTADVNGYQEGRYIYRTGTNTPAATRLFSTKGDQGTIIEDVDVASGKLTWLLNGESFLDAIWFQKIGEDAQPVWDAARGLVYCNGENSYASVYDEDSYATFRAYIIEQELEYCNTVVASQDVIDTYYAQVESWAAIETLDAFLAAYKQSLSTKELVKASALVYEDYMNVCAGYRTDLETNPIQNDNRVLFEKYLDEAKVEAPGQFPNGSYAYIIENHTLTNEEVAAEVEYVRYLMSRVVAGDALPGTDISVLMANPDLKAGFEGWTMEYTGSKPTAGGENFFPTVESWNDTYFDMYQELTDLKNGIYELRLNGAYRPYADLTGTWSAGVMYLNDNVNFLMTEGEDIVLKTEAEDGVNCHLTGEATDYSYVYGDVEGWVPMGPIGGSYAFRAGRYVNYTAVEVTDGKIKIGVQNMGTGLAKDWMTFGNFRLTYLGTAEDAVADERLTTILEGYAARAQQIIDFPFSDASDANKYPAISVALLEQLEKLMAAKPANAAEKMELVNKYSKLFLEIQECRRAYADMAVALDKVNDLFDALHTAGIINDDEYGLALGDMLDGWDGYQQGTFSAEDCRAMIEKLDANPLFPQKDEAGYYEIESPTHLGIFSFFVNTGEEDANAVLTTDLDMSGITFTPIGWNLTDDNGGYTSGAPLYKGHFDGQGHRISNLVIEKPGKIGVGLFGNITSPAHIENLVLDKTCSVTGGDRAGLIGRSTNSGKVTLNNLGNEGDVFADTAPAGIMGNANSSSIAVITDCYSTGKITMATESLIGSSDKNAALICGWLANLGATITNCWSTADITNYQSVDRALCRQGGDNNTYVNNYSTFATQAIVVSPEAFTTGEVTYKLNRGATEGDIVWYQTIGTDEHPVFAGEGHLIVNKNGEGTYYNLEDAIRTVAFELGNSMNVYDGEGRMVRSDVTASAALKGLKSGLYILKGNGGKSVKVLVK